jgi:hypothetical protein
LLNYSPTKAKRISVNKIPLFCLVASTYRADEKRIDVDTVFQGVGLVSLYADELVAAGAADH